jgi:hypothetical protein
MLDFTYNLLVIAYSHFSRAVVNLSFTLTPNPCAFANPDSIFL